MEKPRPRVVVAGDAAIDWFMYPEAGRDEGPNWQRHASSRAVALPGGAFLLSQFIRDAVAAAGLNVEVVAPAPPGEIRVTPPEQVIHSNAFLKFYSVDNKDKGKRADQAPLRIKDWLGFIGPQSGRSVSPPAASQPDRADIVVLDDAGNGFRDAQQAWPRAIWSDSQPIVVQKMYRPLVEGPLWNRLVERGGPGHVLIINAADLRRTAGVDISQSLSWERTAKDCLFAIQRSGALKPLQNCPHVVILFGTDGAIVHHGGDTSRATLVFDPLSLEGTFASRIDGCMSGLASIFTANLVVSLLERGIAGLECGIRRGLSNMRRLLKAGYRKTDAGIEYASEQLFVPGDENHVYPCCEIERPQDLNVPDPHFWRILDQQTRHTGSVVAEELVRCGKADGLRGVPVGVFGKLQTTDRAEIESYAAIRELIVEFLANPKPERPLSFAVFGPPGSGKSFGVKQVLKSIQATDLETVGFNISQFREYQDLIAAFHQVRNISLRGKVPFVFFDEFDSANSEGPRGWLKYFLAPMQDGEFKEAGAVHPIGKSIFVFAGGTCATYQSFLPAPALPDADERTRSQAAHALSTFVAAKGPDFVSRLRGYINVMGPNRQHVVDNAYLIRRAMLLRSLLKQNPKATGAFDSHDRLRIDPGVLRALLYVGSYRHGTRSMEAILDMSRLAGRDRFELSALPPKDQLDLHVDGDEFLLLAQRERFLSLLAASGTTELAAAGGTEDRSVSFREREQRLVLAAARGIHEAYLRHRNLDGAADASTASFDQLPPEKQRSNLDAAADIPQKLRSINHGLRRLVPGKPPRTPDITDEEILTLARREHDRWVAEQRFQGFVPGPIRDPILRTSPYLGPFDQLSPDIQQYDVQSIYMLPVILRNMGNEVYRLVEGDELDDPRLVDALARIVHAGYVQERTKKGETPQANPSLVAFDQLPPDLKESNLDNAASIPRKLRKLGYDLYGVPPGTEPALLVLSDQEYEQLAMMEHTRWNWQRILQGWVHKSGPKDNDKKTTPYLVPWKQLPEEIKGYDRETVLLIPQLLHHAGYEARRRGNGC